MLADRFKITQAVGQYKAVHGLPPADGAREKAQIERLRALAKSANLDPEFSEKFLSFIIHEVIRHHERLRDGASPARRRRQGRGRVEGEIEQAGTARHP